MALYNIVCLLEFVLDLGGCEKTPGGMSGGVSGCVSAVYKLTIIPISDRRCGMLPVKKIYKAMFIWPPFKQPLIYPFLAGMSLLYISVCNWTIVER